MPVSFEMRSLVFAKIFDARQCFRRDSGKGRSERQMIRKCMNGGWVLYSRRPTQRGANHRVRRRGGVVMRETGIDADEPGVAGLHGAVYRLHVRVQEFFRQSSSAVVVYRSACLFPCRRTALP